jgi:hypothetical protein
MKALIILFVLWAAMASAQTVTIDPTTIDFLPSADHYETNLDGTYVVAKYQFDAVPMNGIGTIVSIDLQRPSLNSAGHIVVDLSAALSTITPNVTYTATVSAIGQPGTTPGVSLPSNPFARAGTPKAPAAPTSVRVIKP